MFGNPRRKGKVNDRPGGGWEQGRGGRGEDKSRAVDTKHVVVALRALERRSPKSLSPFSTGNEM